jgi:hypothetical protein
MEWWIIATLFLVLVLTCLVNRLRQARRRRSEAPPNTIYPLW